MRSAVGLSYDGIGAMKALLLISTIFSSTHLPVAILPAPDWPLPVAHATSPSPFVFLIPILGGSELQALLLVVDLAFPFRFSFLLRAHDALLPVRVSGLCELCELGDA